MLRGASPFAPRGRKSKSTIARRKWGTRREGSTGRVVSAEVGKSFQVIEAHVEDRNHVWLLAGSSSPRVATDALKSRVQSETADLQLKFAVA